MYKIIGGDGNEYGPVSDAQLRQWIAEGRAGGQTQVQREGESEWKPLAALPEFAAGLGAQAHAPTAAATTPPTFSSAAGGDAGAAHEAALHAVSAPATALKVTAIVCLICSVLGLLINVLILAGVKLHLHPMPNAELQKLVDGLGSVVGLIQSLVGIGVSIVIWNGAAQMQVLKKHQFVFTACILAMLPCVSPCCFLGLPFGIWAMVVLNRPEVKSQFN